MKINFKKVFEVLFISFPMLLVIAGLSFCIGIFASTPDDAKYMTILIGLIAAIFAFVGVAYSKNKEKTEAEVERKMDKVESFFLKLIESMDDLAFECKIAYRAQYEKIKSTQDISYIDSLFDELNNQRMKVYVSRSQLSMYQGIYSEYIGYKIEVNTIIKSQNKIANLILDITDCTNMGSLNSKLRETSELIAEGKKLVVSLANKIKVV